MAPKVRAVIDRAIAVFYFLMLVSLALLPGGYIVSLFYGYDLVITNTAVFAVTITVFPVLAVVLSKASENVLKRKAVRVLIYASLALAFIDGTALLIKSRGLIVIVCVALSFVSIAYLTVKCAVISRVKYTSVIPLLIVIIASVFVGTIIINNIINGVFGSTVVKTALSPSGDLYAEVISIDEGALGGSTVVKVYRDTVSDFGFFRLKLRPKIVYSGRWSDQFDIRIYWKDNRHLMINSTEYTV